MDQSPLSKRPKLDDFQEVDKEDLSFLDDIDIDEIADCLKNCDETSNQDNSIRSHYSTSTSKKNVIKECNSPPKSSRCRKDDKKLLFKLEKKLFDFFHEQYVPSIIHYGKHSTIIKCKHGAWNKYAVKILKDKEQKYLGKAKQEMLLQMQMNIPKENLFCIYFREGFSLQKHWCFLMEFYPKTLNQAMHEYNKPFHINKVQELARQLVAAVTVLKYNDIIHSDIRPSHILLNSSNEKLRLCGFDAAHYIGAGKTSSNQGTLNYRPPEVILGYSSGFSIDVWSTAIVLVEMATGLITFPGHTNNDILFGQMSMLGSIPNEMLDKSKYRSQYFHKDMFKRQVGSMLICSGCA
ncbi:serine/threonine-protein kinase PRP4 homolog isoform X2 [Maniola jurtina]|uniref:serine/threonine-protein kinase PRP4 homolog isoform X2 n=1 Tax=Maniola jurtina TaxID=191418 RepID=UPI001E68D917|nr:serine/threonine-protein kinase PRP4 homolog isoform X2 [Maniola jurtina]